MKILYSCAFPLKKARVRDFGKQFLCVTTLFPRLSCLPTFVCSHSSLSFTNLPKSGIAPLASRTENWLAAGCRPRATGFRRSSRSVRWLTGPLCKRLAAPPRQFTIPSVRCLRPCRSPFRPPPCLARGLGSRGSLGWPSGRLPNRPRQSPPRAWSYEEAPGSAARGDPPWAAAGAIHSGAHNSRH